ncbi:UNVERIFIED_CONTAM: hypothetical protein Sradi_3651400 [Sesamum radiatum]|uniref:Uncharacterized protein n=1 Tax=Sesamum radiatum TaxID=300843 RepID=A0AAW2QK20_SESRA
MTSSRSKSTSARQGRSRHSRGKSLAQARQVEAHRLDPRQVEAPRLDPKRVEARRPN